MELVVRSVVSEKNIRTDGHGHSIMSSHLGSCVKNYSEYRKRKQSKMTVIEVSMKQYRPTVNKYDNELRAVRCEQ